MRQFALRLLQAMEQLDGHAELHKRGCCSCGLLIRAGGSAGLLYLRAVLGGGSGRTDRDRAADASAEVEAWIGSTSHVPSLTSAVDPWSFSGSFWADYYTLQA
jgi:hypothetical protein